MPGIYVVLVCYGIEVMHMLIKWLCQGRDEAKICIAGPVFSSSLRSVAAISV